MSLEDSRFSSRNTQKYIIPTNTRNITVETAEPIMAQVS